MKVTSIELHPHNSALVAVLSFRDPARTLPYNVVDIQGLDPDMIVPRYYGVSGNSKAKFYDFSLNKKDVVMLVSLNPDFETNQSYSDLRDGIYKFISASRTGMIEIQFKNGADVVALLTGPVTKVEAATFEKAPAVKLTISPDDPVLRAPAAVVVPVAGLNPADTVITDLISTAPHGFAFQMAFTGAVASVTISDTTFGLPLDDRWSFIITPAGGFLNGDLLNFSSYQSSKNLDITRGGGTILLADKVTPGSIWPVIFPGDNHIGFTSPASMHWNSISYVPAFWGV